MGSSAITEIQKSPKQENKKGRNLLATAFSFVFLRILQDVSREKAMEQMFA
jgi:hypothetical protein